MSSNSTDYESILSSILIQRTLHQVVNNIPCSILKKRNNDDDRSSNTCSMSRSSSDSSSRSERSQDDRIPQHHYNMHRVSFALKEDVTRGIVALNDVLCKDDIEDCSEINTLQEEDPEISTFETVIKEYERDMQKLEEVNASLTEKVSQLMVDKAQQEEEDIYVDMVLNEEKLQKTIRKLTRKLKIERQLTSQLAENLKSAADKIKDTENERDAWKEKYEQSMSMKIY